MFCEAGAPASDEEGLAIFGGAAETDRTVSRDPKGFKCISEWLIRTGCEGREQVRLGHVHLPLYPHVFEGIGLAVSAGESIEDSEFRVKHREQHYVCCFDSIAEVGLPAFP